MAEDSVPTDWGTWRVRFGPRFYLDVKLAGPGREATPEELVTTGKLLMTLGEGLRGLDAPKPK